MSYSLIDIGERLALLEAAQSGGEVVETLLQLYPRVA